MMPPVKLTWEASRVGIFAGRIGATLPSDLSYAYSLKNNSMRIEGGRTHNVDIANDACCL